MSDLRELYQQIIIDHGRHPRNFGVLADANHSKIGFNPLCGDKIILHVAEHAGKITNLSFEGSGCAISMASTSLMTELLKGKSKAEVADLFTSFHQLVTQGEKNETNLAVDLQQKLGKLAVLKGVSEFPARVKCATLAWHTLNAALADDPHPVSTEIEEDAKQ